MEIQWRWKWAGKPWKTTKGLEFYDALVRIDPDNRVPSRTFRRGDTVCMIGDDTDSNGSDMWVAQLLDFIQVNDESKLEGVQIEFESDPLERKYTHMRCTIRWFYAEADVDKSAIKNIGLTPTLDKEYFFTDDVEVPGYNDVQVIEGRAWVFESDDKRKAFIKNPDPTYDPTCDIVCVTRGYVSSQKTVRKLCPGELDYLLITPTDAKMFSKAHEIMTGRPFSRSKKGETAKKSQSAGLKSHTSEDAIQSTPTSKQVATKSDFQSAPKLKVEDIPNSFQPENSVSSEENSDKDKDFCDVDVDSGSQDTDDGQGDGALDPVVRGEFEKRFTRTGRRRVTFNKSELNDGSDYEDDVVKKSGRSKHVTDRATRHAPMRKSLPNFREGNLSTEKELPNDNDDSDDDRLLDSIFRKSRASLSNVDNLSRESISSLIRKKRSSTNSGKTSAILGGHSHARNVRKRPSHTRPSKPREDHLSMFRSLRNVKTPKSVYRGGSGNVRKALSNSKRKVHPLDKEDDDSENENNETVLPFQPQVLSDSQTKGTVQFLQEEEANMTNLAANGAEFALPRDANKGVEDSSAAVRRVEICGNSTIPASTKTKEHSSSGTSVAGHKESLTSSKELHGRKSAAGSPRVNRNVLLMDSVNSIETGKGKRKRSFAENPELNDSANDLDADLEELHRLFVLLSADCQNAVVDNRDMLVESTLWRINLKTRQGRRPLGETMVDDIVRDVCKELALDENVLK